ISPCDAANLAVAELMRDLKRRGVHVATIDSDMDRETLRDTRFALIGTDNLAGGRELAKCAKNLRPERGEYVTFVGRTGTQNAIDSDEGVRHRICDQFRALTSMVAETDQGSPQKREMFHKKTEFLKLADSRRWLEKYRLTGS